MDELKELKLMADKLGIQYAKNAGIEKIQRLIDEKEAESLEGGSVDDKKKESTSVKKPTKKDATKLSLIVLSNMDPADAHKTTEEVNLSNDAFGKICHRVIPYGVEWVCEEAGIEYLKAKKFMRKVTKKTPKGNVIEQIPTQKFNIVVKELTKEIIDKQKKRQSARGE